jgi:hypothetical protein
VSRSPFKLHDASGDAINKAKTPESYNPAETAKKAVAAGETLVEAGQEEMTTDGETPIPWPPAVAVKSKPFKI